MGWSAASGRHELEARLRALGGKEDAAIDLAEAALLLASLDRPRVSLDRYSHHIDLLRQDLAKAATAESLESQAAALRQVMAEGLPS